MISGQSGLLAAALLTAGLRCLRRQPVLAGFLLGLLTYKPTLGLLVPVALIAARAWRAIASACLTFLLLAAVSSAVFGGSIWLRWIGTMPLHWQLFEANSGALIPLMPTVSASISLLGASTETARMVQITAILAVAAVVWICFRRGAGDRSIAALQIGTLLATPYAFIYDMPMVTSAAILAGPNSDRPVRLPEAAVLVLALGFPLCMLALSGRLPLEPLFLAIMFGVVAFKAQGEGCDRLGVRP